MLFHVGNVRKQPRGTVSQSLQEPQGSENKFTALEKKQSVDARTTGLAAVPACQ